MKLCTFLRFLVIATVSLVGSISVFPAKAGQSADLIIVNAKVIPASTNLPLAQAVAIQDGKILAVGKERQVLHYKGTNTRVIDAKGASVLPGLIDNEVYSYKASVSKLNEAQPVIHSIAEALDYIRAQASAQKTNEWIVVNWLYPTRLKEGRLPTKAELDAAAPKHPVFWNCGPVSMINTRAFQVAKITNGFPNPPGGEIVLGDDRKFTGRLIDAESILKLPPQKPVTPAQHREALQNLYKLYNQQGITSITEHDASPEAIDLFRDMNQAGELTVRVSCDRFVRTGDTKEESIKYLNALTNATGDKLPYGPSGVGDDWVRIGHLNVKMDGDVTSGTSYLRAPWGIGPTYQITELAYKGRIYQDPEIVTAMFVEAAQQGWQISADCSGDAALDELLNSYQKTNFKIDIRQRRFIISHARFQAKQNWERCIKYGIGTEMQPAVLYKDGDSLIKTLGEKRLNYFLPYKSFFETGTIVGSGSDHRTGLNPLDSISPFNPWLGMASANSRTTEGGKQTHPEEKISREEAIETYTKNNAWMTFEEKKKGTLEPGKFADLIMVDTDLMKCSDEEVRQTKVILTIVGGKIVWEAK